MNGEHLLDSFHTTIALPPNLPIGMQFQRELNRRAFPEVPRRSVVSHPTRESVRLLARRFGISSLVKHEEGWACVDSVFESLDRSVAGYLRQRNAAESKAVYAYEDGALHSFQSAKALGMTCIYDLPIAHWHTHRRVLEEECELKPDWAGTMTGLKDSSRKQDRKDQEVAAADRIIVASSFTRQSLIDYFGDTLSIDVVPYGAPPSRISKPARRGPDEPLKIFYAGHLRQRKGVAYLIEALATLDFDWRVTLAGPMPEDPPAELLILLQDPRCRWLGAIPHPTLLEAMRTAHVFVFPSLVEGFGLVLLEAMGAGLPVITTPNTAGPDIMDHGVEGFIVPIRDSDAIARALTQLFDDEDFRRTLAAAALTRAKALSWKAYEERISSILKQSQSS
jgi:glycosyltransferase involved in cell wall biosynthesis